MIPVFVKGNLKFTLEGATREFLHQNVSAYGMTGLPWGELNPKEAFGKTVQITVQVLTEDPFTFHGEAVITREQTLFNQSMGLRFQLADADRTRLEKAIRDHGSFPTDYIRKYPRIPSMTAIKIFPLRAIVTPIATEEKPVSHSYDVTNLSPNGTLIHTENQAALLIQPGAKLDLILEPRGWFPMPIRCHGQVCRVGDEIDPVSGNTARYLGIKFTVFDEVNRLAFVDLLKEILENYKKTGGA